jgi:hypothetical protein
MSDRIGIVGTVERHVADPKRREAELVGQRGELKLFAGNWNDLARPIVRQHQAQRQGARRKDAVEDCVRLKEGQGDVVSSVSPPGDGPWRPWAKARTLPVSVP